MSNYKAKVVSIVEGTKTKSNGGEVQLCQTLITEGPLKGLTVLAQRTIKNAEGVSKPSVSVNQEVTLYHSQLESTTNPGTMQNFFEVSTGLGATQDDINARLALAVSAATANTLAEQTV